MQRHDRDGVLGLALAARLGDEGDVLEETGEVLELLHRADEFLEVLEPPGSLGRLVLLPHLRVAAFVQHELGELGVGQGLDLAGPAVEIVDQPAQRIARLGLHLLRLGKHARRLHQRHALRARVIVKLLQRRIAEAALGRVDDALEGEVVGSLRHAAQIGERVANLEPLVEARAANDPVGQADGDEAVLELAHLERGAHEDRGLVQLVALPLQLLQLLADGARLLFRIPQPRSVSASRRPRRR